MADPEITGKPVVSPNYKGPTTSFPFKAFRNVGLMHLFLGIAAEFIGIIHLTLGPEHRDIFLQFAAAPLWCPIPVIIVGILGILVSRKRYWEVRCMKMWFGILSLVNAFLFMVVMGTLVGFYGYWYYSVSTFEPAEADEELKLSENLGYTVVISIVLIIAGLEVLLGLVSVFIVCCCAAVRRPDDSPEKVVGTIPERSDNTIPKPKGKRKEKIIIIQSTDPHAATLAREYGIPPTLWSPPSGAAPAPVHSPHGNGMLPPSFVASPASPAHTVHFGDEPEAASASQSTEAPKKKKKKGKKKKQPDQQASIQASAPSAPEEPPPPFSPHAYAPQAYAPQAYAPQAYAPPYSNDVYGYASGPLGASGSLYPDLAAIQSVPGPSVVFTHSNIPIKQ